jgi:hypothetical protein
MRPWKATPEQEQKEHHWADYAAWTDWIVTRQEQLNSDGDILGQLDYQDESVLYLLMCELADQKSEVINEAREAARWLAENPSMEDYAIAIGRWPWLVEKETP